MTSQETGIRKIISEIEAEYKDIASMFSLPQIIREVVKIFGLDKLSVEDRIDFGIKAKHPYVWGYIFNNLDFEELDPDLLKKFFAVIGLKEWILLEDKLAWSKLGFKQLLEVGKRIGKPFVWKSILIKAYLDLDQVEAIAKQSGDAVTIVLAMAKVRQFYEKNNSRQSLVERNMFSMASVVLASSRECHEFEGSNYYNKAILRMARLGIGLENYCKVWQEALLHLNVDTMEDE
ncbi:hypothetical protein KKC60_03560 [Patescibacteria group bacterium]|nr:hypothetical protein [Patescibacteria group bacterium]